VIPIEKIFAVPAKVARRFCANVIHIAPWCVAEGLFAGCNRYLRVAV
jgi:hypothetical protein